MGAQSIITSKIIEIKVNIVLKWVNVIRCFHAYQNVSSLRSNNNSSFISNKVILPD